MKHEDLPQRWKDKIHKYLTENGRGFNYYGNKHERFSVYDFVNNLNLKISFLDGSYAFFNDSFYWIDKEAKKGIVFTEHCGYHLFNLPEILIETVDWEGSVIKTDDYRTE